MSLLQGILARAIEDSELQANPAAVVKKPSGRRERTPIALSPAQLEQLLEALPTLRDRMLAELVAYSGPRPQDALGLAWTKIGPDRIRYDIKNVDGRLLPGARQTTRSGGSRCYSPSSRRT
jgi:integrase